MDTNECEEVKELFDYLEMEERMREDRMKDLEFMNKRLNEENEKLKGIISKYQDRIAKLSQDFLWESIKR